MADKYKTIDASDIAYFRTVCAAERVIPGGEVGEDYCHDELSGVRRRPDVLIKAQSTAEVSAVMKYAYEKVIPVTPRGQGTNQYQMGDQR